MRLPTKHTKVEDTVTRSEYNKCVDEYADSLYRFLLKNMRDADLSADLVQDTFERVWKKAPEVEYAKARSYFFTTAYHVMVDYVRRNRTQPLTEADVKMHNHSHQYTGANEALSKALDLLPVIQRTVLLLRDYEGYDYKEIGHITNLTESQVKVYIFRARTFLKNYLVSIDNVL